MLKRLLQISVVIALIASSSGCCVVRRCIVCPMRKWKHSVRERTWCGNGCGETYCSEWHNDPPCCHDPCCNCGHYHGPHHMGPLPMHPRGLMPGPAMVPEGEPILDEAPEPTPAPTPEPMSRRRQPRRTASIEGMRLGEERIISEKWTDRVVKPAAEAADELVADRRQ